MGMRRGKGLCVTSGALCEGVLEISLLTESSSYGYANNLSPLNHRSDSDTRTALWHGVRQDLRKKNY
jgi:hypothetical protein